MNNLKMVMLWKFLSVLHCALMVQVESASIAPSPFVVRYPRRLQQQSGYLPPYTNMNYGENWHAIGSSQAAHAKQSVNTNLKLMSHITYKPHNSYEPPASGTVSFHYSTPQPSNKISLPTLIPQSILDHLSKATSTLTSSPPLSTSTPTQQHFPALRTEGLTTTASVLMVEEPMSLQLTESQNKTLSAAKLLASTLLQANDEPPLSSQEPKQEVHVLYPNSEHGSNQKINTTDLVIVKSQKNAYIIPTHMVKDPRNEIAVRELYQMRDQLEKAYTINQFIFIIKPEKINFLNKLV